jgi:hypothetical protein
VARESVRAIAICEDKGHQSFLARLFGRLHISPVRIIVKPNPGSAEQWVREQLPKEATAHRSRAGHQANLLLVVMTDGDRFGFRDRKASLDTALVRANLPERRAHERILYLVPTWSIETWLAWLSGAAGVLGGIDEMTAYKNHGPYKRLLDAGNVSTKLAVAAWVPPLPNEGTTVPSLSDAREELASRLP